MCFLAGLCELEKSDLPAQEKAILLEFALAISRADDIT